jgi:hypothetical protein
MAQSVAHRLASLKIAWTKRSNSSGYAAHALSASIERDHAARER